MRPRLNSQKLIALAIYTGQLNGRLDSEGGDIQLVLWLAPTLWPIVFAAVVGRTLTTVATYKAEQGSRLGVNCSPCSSNSRAN